MSQNRVKTGVVVVSVSRQGHHSFHRKKPGKVIHVNINPSSRAERVRTIQKNDNKTGEKNQKLSHDLNLKDGITRSAPRNQYQLEALSINPIHLFVHEMIEHTSTHGTNAMYPWLITRSRPQSDAVLITSSFRKPFSSCDHRDTSLNLSRTKSIEKYQEKQLNQRSQRYTGPVFEIDIERSEMHKNNKRKRRHHICKGCAAFSSCCCLASTIGALLLLMGLAALLLYVFSKGQTTTTTTITITSITSTINTTPTPPCVPTSVGSSSILYTRSSGTAPTYTCLAYAWTPLTTGPVSLTFQLRHDPSYWLLDDVSIYAGATQMLTNGGFETGSLSPWVLGSGSCGVTSGQVSTVSPHTGNYSYLDGSNGCADQVSQQFTATAGQLYIVSFWLKSASAGSTITANVTLS